MKMLNCVLSKLLRGTTGSYKLEAWFLSIFEENINCSVSYFYAKLYLYKFKKSIDKNMSCGLRVSIFGKTQHYIMELAIISIFLIYRGKHRSVVSLCQCFSIESSFVSSYLTHGEVDLNESPGD